MKSENKKKFTRRRFIGILLGGIIATEALWVLLRSTGRKDNTQQESVLYDAGAISSFANNQVYPFTSGQFNLVRYKDGGFMAISTKCTHLGCIVNTDADKKGFTCPCHSSHFDIYGEVLESPATRPLDTYSIIFKDGHVWVNIAKSIKRQKFLNEQLYYA